ncbi:MAG TPA: serine/threonine-protein kinase [Tepidisphaeraceae bacterium]|nr:serine/threonine-protein kinase [Tepidisphaeraceae bacterium]
MTTDTSDSKDRRAEEIFAATLDMPTEDRPAVIENACGDDSDLRRRVDALAGALQRAEGFLADATVDGPSETEIAAVGEKPGDTIGRYKLLEKIGEGGFGVVFTAEQQKPVRRLVAIKVIKLGMDTREVVSRFEAERQALALMDHPNIAKVLDAGATDTGRPYFVMELVRGCPITDYADQRKLSTVDRVALASQVCRAVQHAHSKGIIHRDLKPTNVLVTVTDDKPVPKVIDFGIAKATQGRLADHTLYTAHRQLIGTPQYMSPEQADSYGSDIDTRTDVYSLGVLLYELLVGTTPFDARSLRSAAHEEMRRIIRDDEVPRLSTKLNTMAADSLGTIATNRSTDLKKLNQSVKGELDWIVMKALEKDRTRRYETAAAMADDLNRYLAGEAVLAGPVSSLYRLKKTARRYRAAFAVAAAVAVVLLVGISGTTWGLIRESRLRVAAESAEKKADTSEKLANIERQDALVQKTEADRQKQIALTSEQDTKAKAAEAKATLDFFTTLLSKASPKQTKDAAVSQVLVDKLIKPALATIDSQFKEQPLVRASIQATLARTLLDLGRYDLAEQQAKAAYDARQHLLPADHPDTLAALGGYAGAIKCQGRYAEAERLDKQLWDTRRRVQGDDHPYTLAALNNYASAIDEQGRYAEAEPLLKQCWEARRRVQGDDHPDTLTALNSYAVAIEAQGRYAEAEPLLKQCWEARRWVQGDDHPFTLATLNNYASAIDDQGRYAEAERLDKQLWDAERRVQGDDHPDTLMALGNYANAIGAQGRHAEAEPLDKQSWDACRRVMGDDHPETLRALKNYASAIHAQGRHAEAEPLFKQCWDASRRVMGDDHPETLLALRNYAAAIDAQGRHAEAEPLFKQLWDARRRVQGDDNPQALAALNQYANVIAAKGNHAEAEPLLKQCWEARRRVQGDDHTDTLNTLANYAVDIEAQGHHAQAAPLFKQLWDARRRKLGDDHPDTRWALTTYANVLLDNQQFADAEPLFRQDLERLRGLSPQDELQEANAEYGLGRCLAHLGPDHATEAESLLREVVASRSKHLGPHAAPTTRSAGALADLLDGEHLPEAAAKVRADAGMNPTTAATTK